jgi:hypothetical protein
MDMIAKQATSLMELGIGIVKKSLLMAIHYRSLKSLQQLYAES